MPDLDIRDLIIEYKSGDYVVRAIDRLDLFVSSGELVVMLGPSGCGKTTLLSVLAGILKPQSGSVRFGDTDVSALKERALTEYRRATVGVVFQAFNLIPSLTALENVQVPLPLRQRRGPRRRAHAPFRFFTRWSYPIAWLTSRASSREDSSSEWPLREL